MAETDDPPRDLAMHSALRCGARTRRGTPCQEPALRGRRRCRLHGGWSTGPKTPEGRARAALARWRHGRRSKQAVEERKAATATMRRFRELLAIVAGRSAR